MGVAITSGPHKDTQELQVPAFRWFNRHLKNDESLVREPAEKFFEPEQLRVFQSLPEDQKNTAIQETFVAAAGAAGRACQRRPSGKKCAGAGAVHSTRKHSLPGRKSRSRCKSSSPSRPPTKVLTCRPWTSPVRDRSN